MKKKWEAQESLPIEELREITNEEREYEAVIEAVLFTMGNSVEVRQLAAAIGQDEETARSAVKRLMKQYEAGRKGMQIIELENSYQMCTRPEYYENLIRVAATPKKQVLTEVGPPRRSGPPSTVCYNGGVPSPVRNRLDSEPSHSGPRNRCRDPHGGGGGIKGKRRAAPRR